MVVGAGLLVMTLAGQAADANLESRATFAPPDGEVLVLIGQDLDSINAYVEATGTVPAGFMVYTSIQELQGLKQPAEYGAGVIHAQALMERYPHTVLQIGLWMVGALDGITRGHYNAQIDRFANWLRSVDRPVYLRIGYEFDLPDNGYDPEAYVRAYRYLVDRLRYRDVSNVAYVWHSFAADSVTPLTAWYPGDEYVDWCAVSYFNQGWGDLESMAAFAREHQKPLMIAEATPRGISTADEQAWTKWFQECASFIAHAKVKAFSYINTDWEALRMFQGQGWGDSRVEANPAVQETWLTTVRNPSYLHASLELYDTIDYQ